MRKRTTKSRLLGKLHQAYNVVFSTLLLAVLIVGIGTCGWAAMHFGAPPLENAAIAHNTFISSMLLTGVTMIYCAIAGFTLSESRRMREQSVRPHLQASQFIKSDEGISVTLENTGAGTAIQVYIHAWVLAYTGSNQPRTPERHVYFVEHHAIQTNSPMQLLLTPDPNGEMFSDWQDEYKNAGVPANALDPDLIMIRYAYESISGTKVSHCNWGRLAQQVPVPKGSDA